MSVLDAHASVCRTLVTTAAVIGLRLSAQSATTELASLQDQGSGRTAVGVPGTDEAG